MRKPFVVGNWKMNLSLEKAVTLAEGIKAQVSGYDAVDIGVAPVACCIPAVVGVFAGTGVLVGGQNIHYEPKGAFTGEVSAPILASTGARFAIIGHSERRQYFGETNETVAQKIKAALASDLLPIVCVGETLEEREADKTRAVVRDHVEGALSNLSADEMLKITVAYEPVWAIGTDRTATPEQAQEVHGFIRGILSEMFGESVADAVRIQYGGSVKPDNVKGLMAQPDIDGGLIGGASLDAESFAAIVRFGE